MFQIISYITAFQAIFFGVLIASKKNKNKFDNHLSAWLFFLAVNILCITLSQNYESNLLLYSCYMLSGMHGFFLFLCTSSSVNEPEKSFRKEHYVIIVSISVYLIGLLFCNSYPKEAMLIGRKYAFVLNALFVVFSVKLFHKCKMLLLSNLSNIDLLNFRWMSFLAYGLIVLLAGAFVFVVLRESLFDSFPLYNLYSIAVLIFVNALIFAGVKHTTIFNQIIQYYPQKSEEKQSAENEKTYSGYGLKKEDAVLLAEKLKTYMNEKMPYTQMDLNLRDLSSALETYPHYITQVLNTVFNQNFYDFVNSYRIEEVKRRLKDPEFSNLTIAFDCGFNSKSTFNRIFKLKTGFTPREYKNR